MANLVSFETLKAKVAEMEACEFNFFDKDGEYCASRGRMAECVTFQVGFIDGEFLSIAYDPGRFEKLVFTLRPAENN